jgi:ribosomal protein L32
LDFIEIILWILWLGLTASLLIWLIYFIFTGINSSLRSPKKQVDYGVRAEKAQVCDSCGEIYKGEDKFCLHCGEPIS